MLLRIPRFYLCIIDDKLALDLEKDLTLNKGYTFVTASRIGNDQ